MTSGFSNTFSMRRCVVGLAILAAIVISGACSINPATGQRQFSLIGEQQEIAMGAEYDKGVEAELGLYPDEELQHYVQDLGGRLAAQSERPTCRGSSTSSTTRPSTLLRCQAVSSTSPAGFSHSSILRRSWYRCSATRSATSPPATASSR